MAKFKIEYTIHLGDRVSFNDNGYTRMGIVQDISQLPDVFVEGYSDGEYKRWRRGIDSLDFIWSEHEDFGKQIILEYEKNENIEFIYGENDELIYRKAK